MVSREFADGRNWSPEDFSLLVFAFAAPVEVTKERPLRMPLPPTSLRKNIRRLTVPA